MPYSVSDLLGVPPAWLDQAGAFDAILDVDSELYIDPFLLRGTSVHQLAGAHDRLCQRFAAVQAHLRVSRREGDENWNRAVAMLAAGEAPLVCIGVASRGTAGSGIGLQTAEALASTIQSLLRSGIDDPELFELLPFIQDGVGRDRLSDWTARVIEEDLLAYTDATVRALGTVDVDFVTIRGHRLPRNPFQAGPVVLLPREILRSTPTILSWPDREGVAAAGKDLAELVTALVRARGKAKGDKPVAATWGQVLSLVESDRLPLFLTRPQLVQLLLRAYRARQPKPYDFENDPRAVLNWYRALGEFLEGESAPVVTAGRDLDGLFEFSRAVEGAFARLVEGYASMDLFYEGSKARAGAVAARLFWGLWEQTNEQIANPFPGAESAPRGIRIFLGTGIRSCLHVVVGGLHEAALRKEVERLLKGLAFTRDRSRVVVVALDTENGHPAERRRLSEIVGTQSAWARLVVVNATYSRFRSEAAGARGK